METFSYSVGELKRLIKESQNEFEPVLGPKVKEDNKRNNEKSYNDAEKRTKDYDGGVQTKKKGNVPDRFDYNATTLDYNPVTEPDDEYKKRIKAQAKGYTSELEEKNGSEKNGQFDDDSKILKSFEKTRDEKRKERNNLAKAGLMGREMKSEIDNFPKNNTLSEAKKPTKKLTFKKRFINESNMLQRIPEEYKKDGQVIIMEDREGNEYTVECSLSKRAGIVETNVINFKNKKQLSEQVNRMFELMDDRADGAESFDKVNESVSFAELMDLARNKKTVL